MSAEEAVYNKAWAKFFLNETLVTQFLKETKPEVVQATLACGYTWSGASWNTTRASKELKRLTGVSLVSARLDEYSHAFLFSLALVKGLEVDKLELSYRCGEAAFQLADVWTAYLGTEEASSSTEKKGKTRLLDDVVQMEDDDEEDVTAERLPWEEPLAPLPAELQTCLQHVQQGTRLPWRQILSEVPTFQGLKARAEDNNHGADAKAPQDRLLKSLQQKVLNLQRMQACLFVGLAEPANEYTVLLQQTFYATAELENTLLKERKRRSIPGAVPTTQHGLFSKEDLSIEKQQAAVNAAGMYGFYDKTGPQCRFPTGTGPKFLRWKPQPLHRGRAMEARGWRPGYGSQYRAWRPRPRHGATSFTTQVRHSASFPTVAKAGREHPQDREVPCRGEQHKVLHGGGEVQVFNNAHSGVEASISKPVGNSMHSTLLSPSCRSQDIRYPSRHSSLPKVSVGSERLSAGYHDSSGRKALGKRPTLETFAKFFGLVEKARKSRGAGIDRLRGKGRLATALSFVTNLPPKSRRRNQGCSKHPQGVSNFRGNHKNIPRKGETSCALLHHLQKRRRFSEKQVNNRLQRVESVFHPAKVQSATYGVDISISAEELMVFKNRPKGCLFSSKTPPQPVPLGVVKSGGRILAISRSLLRNKHTPPKIHVTHES